MFFLIAKLLAITSFGLLSVNGVVPLTVMSQNQGGPVPCRPCRAMFRAVPRPAVPCRAGHGPGSVMNRTLVRVFGDIPDDFPMKKALRNCSWRPFGLKPILLMSFSQNDPRTVPNVFRYDFPVTVFR